MESIAAAVGAEQANTYAGGASAAEPAPDIRPAGPGLGAVFTAETGPGEVDDYINHPLNPGKSAGMAQVLRGLTGLVAVFGVASLRLALLDLALGVVQLVRRPPAVVR